MKASHYHAPRSLAECSFVTSADPIERPTHKVTGHSVSLWLMALAFAIAALIVILLRA